MDRFSVWLADNINRRNGEVLKMKKKSTIQEDEEYNRKLRKIVFK